MWRRRITPPAWGLTFWRIGTLAGFDDPAGAVGPGDHDEDHGVGLLELHRPEPLAVPVIFLALAGDRSDQAVAHQHPIGSRAQRYSMLTRLPWLLLG